MVEDFITSFPNFCCRSWFNFFLFTWKVFSNKPDPNNLSPATPLHKLGLHHLLLSRSLSIGLLCSPLRSLSCLSVIGPGNSELSILRWSILLLCGDLAFSDSWGIWSNWESGNNRVLSSSLEVLGAGVTLLWLAKPAWEEDEFRLVGLKTLNIGGESWYGVVDTAVVDGDTDCAGKGSRDLCSLYRWVCLTSGDRMWVCTDICHTFNSSKVKPLPARRRRLYLMVGHRTTGLSLSTGRGARAAALVILAFLLRSLRPGWSKWVRTRVCHCFRKWLLGICCSVETRS